jgi:hypothetical protein
MKLDELLLLSGNDVPFPQAQLVIHVPTLKEIGYIGEENFHMGCHFVIFDKNSLSQEDKNNLGDLSNFDIFMSVMNSHEKSIHKTNALSVLSLLFPNYEIKFEKDKMLLQKENFSSIINEQNYEDFKEILVQIFCLERDEKENVNPADALAAKIAEKIKKGKEKVAKSKGEGVKKLNIYSRYISILGVGNNLIDYLNYTIYQLRDQFERFQLKESNDIYIKAKLAGAQNMEEVDNWMEDIHP